MIAPDAWFLAMRRGDFEEAWRVSDHALRRGAPNLPRHEQQIWDGSSVCGKRVLVRCYHGLGDTLQFARFLPRLREIAAEVIVWAQPDLLDLLGTISEACQLMPLHDGAPAVEYDVDVEIMELGHVFRATLDTLPVDVPYLRVEPAKIERNARLCVGIAWRGGDWNGTRSIPFESLRPLLNIPKIAWYSLDTRAPLPEQCLLELEERKTIAGTAQLIQALDLTISIDSMPAHLSGALGVPTWTLLPAQCDWRWMQARDDSPWYPTMRLFRQQKAGDWDPVIDRVRQELSIGL